MNSDRAEVLAPLAPDVNVLLVGFGSAAEQFSVGTTPHYAGERVLNFSLNVPPPLDSTQGATVTFTVLPFYANPGIQIIPGPWSFQIPPDMLRPTGS